MHNGKRCYLKRQTAADGSWLSDESCPFAEYRLFCDEHSTRGDCSREDCDENYSDVPVRRVPVTTPTERTKS